MKTPLTVAILGALLGSISPLAARDKLPDDQYCSWIKSTPDGKFTYQMQMGWSLARDGADPAAAPLPPEVVGITCLRDPPILVESDLKQLTLGRTLSFGIQDQGMTIVEYELKDGKIAYTVKTGGLGDSRRKKVEKAMAAMQTKLPAAAR